MCLMYRTQALLKLLSAFFTSDGLGASARTCSKKCVPISFQCRLCFRLHKQLAKEQFIYWKLKRYLNFLASWMSAFGLYCKTGIQKEKKTGLVFTFFFFLNGAGVVCEVNAGLSTGPGHTLRLHLITN